MKSLKIGILLLVVAGVFAACHKAQDTHLPNAFTLAGTLYGTPHAVAFTVSSAYQVLTLSSGDPGDTTGAKVIFAVDSLVTPWSYTPYDSSSPASYNSMILAEVSYKDSTMKTLSRLVDGTLTIHKTNPTNFVVDYALAYDSISLTGHYSGTIQGMK
ncbi:MAG TPA: hypothetical protein VGC22_03000 [Chitinophaga sp.]